jgi:hypothetical protein
MIQNEAKWILDYIKTDIGIGVWFSYFDVKRTLESAGIEYSEAQFKKWMTGTAKLAAEQDLCLAHPTEATNYQAILVTATADNAEKVTDAYLHVARTNVGVSDRLELYVDFLDQNAQPGSDGAIAAEAAKGLFEMEKLVSKTLDNMNRQLAEKRREQRRLLREAQAIESSDE